MRCAKTATPQQLSVLVHNSCTRDLLGCPNTPLVVRTQIHKIRRAQGLVSRSEVGRGEIGDAKKDTEDVAALRSNVGFVQHQGVVQVGSGCTGTPSIGAFAGFSFGSHLWCFRRSRLTHPVFLPFHSRSSWGTSSLQPPWRFHPPHSLLQRCNQFRHNRTWRVCTRTVQCACTRAFCCNRLDWKCCCKQRARNRCAGSVAWT